MLREFLYLFILVGGMYIFANLDVLHYDEAFFVSGVVAVLALLLVESTRRERISRALILLSLVISLYGLGLKLPKLLQGRLNYYLVYFLVFVLIGAVNLLIFMLARKYAANSRG